MGTISTAVIAGFGVVLCLLSLAEWLTGKKS